MNLRLSSTALSWAILATVTLAIGTLGCSRHHGSPEQKYTDSVKAVRVVLADHRTEEDISKFTGRHPDRCVATSTGNEICVWKLAKRDRGWRPIVKALGHGGHIKLICDLPTDGTDRDRESCSAHPSYSNRYYYSSRLTSSPTQQISASIKEKRRLEHQKIVQRHLATATTEIQMSILVGDAPMSCSESADNIVVCTWKTHNGTYGHGTLATAIGAPHRKKVRMTCEFPKGQAPRKADGCLIEVGA